MDKDNWREIDSKEEVKGLLSSLTNTDKMQPD